MVRQARSGARGIKAILNELVRLQAARDRVDDLALALDDGERGALGVVRDEVLGDAARVVGAVMQLRLLGVPVQGLDRGRREAAAEGGRRAGQAPGCQKKAVYGLSTP